MCLPDITATGEPKGILRARYVPTALVRRLNSPKVICDASSLNITLSAYLSAVLFNRLRIEVSISLHL